ncbi:MAG: hypothetical protein AAF571_13485 [Verrucomicrobiota bacterium]
MIEGQETEPEPTETLPEEIVLPQTSVQIVNATSVPEISLMVDQKMYYPKFPQGLYTGDAPTPKLKPLYTVTDLATNTQVDHQISYDSNTHQSLIITGDFQMVPAEESKTDATEEMSDESSVEPRVNFLLLSHDLSADEQPLRYRFHNGLVDQKIIINDGQNGQWLEPGRILNFYGQPMVKTFTATIGDKTHSVLIRQEGSARNCTVIFYEKAGEPVFMRAFENNKQSFIFEEASDSKAQP